MPAPTNTSIATATDIGVLSGSTPITITQDAYDPDTAQWYDLYFKYTAVAGDNVIGAFAFGDLTNYIPTTIIYNQSGSGYLGIAGENVPVLFPIDSSAVTHPVYTIGVRKFGGAQNPAGNKTLTLRVQRHVNATAPIGSIVVNDDTNGFPNAIINGSTGAVLQFRQDFPAGERLHILHQANRMLMADMADDTAKLFNTTDFSFIASIAFQTNLAHFGAISGNNSDLFYVGTSQVGNAVIKSVDISGNIVSTWTLPTTGIWSIAPSNDDAILYHNGQTSITQSRIRRWDLVNSVALSDLAADVADYIVLHNILVLTDDTIIVGYLKTSAVTDLFIRRYNASGTILNTYSFGSTTASNDTRICPSEDDLTSFWLWRKLPNGISQFTKIRVSDGVTLVNFSVTNFNEGNYQGVPTATPDVYFSHSESCHFGILSSQLTEAEAGGGGVIRRGYHHIG